MKSCAHKHGGILLIDSDYVGFRLGNPIQVDFNYNGVPQLVMKQTGFVAIAHTNKSIYDLYLVFVSKAGNIPYKELLGKEDIRIRRIQNASWLTKKL